MEVSPTTAGSGEYKIKERRILFNIKRILRRPLALFGVIVILVTIICAIFAPQLSPYSPVTRNVGHYLEQPSLMFPLGTDQLGRDVLSRIIFGSRVALIVSLGAISFGTVVGTLIGLISAYLRGWVDEVLMRVMDAIVSFPSLIIAVGLVGTMGANLLNVIIAIGISNVPFIARVARSQALSVREREFITAARSTGASDWHIIIRHLWPNCTAPVIVQSTLGMAYAILTEAALGFLGLSVQPPTPTWGSMLQYAFPLLDRAPLLSIIPGAAIFLLVLAFNFVGDTLRDELDPRLRGLLN